MKRLSKRDKKAVVSLTAIAGVVLVIFGVIFPFYDAKAVLQSNLARQEQLLGKQIQVVREEAIYTNQLDQLKQLLDQYREGLLDAGDASLATVELEEIVRGVAAEHDIQIARSNPLQERNTGESYTKITLQLNLQSDVNQLTSFLYSLSAHPKFLMVEDFSLNSFRSKTQVRIQPRLKVSGFIRLS